MSSGPELKRGVLSEALGILGGPVLVVDGSLRVLAASSSALALFGGEAPAAAELAGRIGEGGRALLGEVGQGRGGFAPVESPSREGPRVRAIRSLPGGGGILFLGPPQSSASPSAGQDFHGIWTANPGMASVFEIVEKAAAASAPVLIRGETGTGKELVARAIHELSDRSHGPFRAINCAALTPSLLESELFGHVRGAFTGAVRDAPGHFRLADGGTLFLDEVAEIPLDLQAKLLRAIQSKSVIPVGGAEPIPVDVRIVSATHRALRAAVEEGAFRADLMYRIRVVPIFLPPLRDRGPDVLLIAARMTEQMNREGRRQVLSIEPQAQEALLRYGWPGNVRELINALEYAYVMGAGPVLRLPELPREIWSGAGARPPEPPGPEPPRSEDLVEERARVLAALRASRGRRAEAARALGMSRVTLWRRMRTFGLGPADNGPEG